MGTGASKVYLIHQHYLLRVTIWWVHFISTLYLTEHYQQFRDPIDPVCLTTCINITLYHVRIVKGWTIYQFLCVGSMHAHKAAGAGAGALTRRKYVSFAWWRHEIRWPHDSPCISWFTLYTMNHPVPHSATQCQCNVSCPGPGARLGNIATITLIIHHGTRVQPGLVLMYVPCNTALIISLYTLSLDCSLICRTIRILSVI